jgi:hypothetical protein
MASGRAARRAWLLEAMRRRAGLLRRKSNLEGARAAPLATLGFCLMGRHVPLGCLESAEII